MMREYLQGYEVIELAEMGSAFMDGLSRSKLQEALELARTGRIKTLVFFSPDRFTRDIADGVQLRSFLRKYGVKLICFYPVPREVTSDMEILNILTDWQSQQYVEKLREASTRGIGEKVNLQLYPQGAIAYGYQLVGKKRETQIVFKEDEREVVRRIFDMYLYQRVGAASIAQQLNDEQIPAPGGGRWYARSVRKILNKECYSGVWYAYKLKVEKKDGKKVVSQRPKEEQRPIPFPQIVTRAEWEQVREFLTKRQIGRLHEYQYLMSSRLSCMCGRAMIGHSNNNGITDKIYYYYRCNAVFGIHGSCGTKKPHSQPVDDTVWQFAYELLSDPKRLLAGYQEMQEEDRNRFESIDNQIATLEAEIAERTEELESIVDQRTKSKQTVLNNLLDQRAEEYAEAIEKLHARKQVLISEKGSNPFSDENIAEMLEQLDALREMNEALRTINETADFEAKRKIIDLLNLKATYRVAEDGSKWLDIHWLKEVHRREVCTQKTPSPTASAVPIL